MPEKSLYCRGTGIQKTSSKKASVTSIDCDKISKIDKNVLARVKQNNLYRNKGIELSGGIFSS